MEGPAIEILTRSRYAMALTRNIQPTRTQRIDVLLIGMLDPSNAHLQFPDGTRARNRSDLRRTNALVERITGLSSVEPRQAPGDQHNNQKRNVLHERLLYVGMLCTLESVLHRPKEVEVAAFVGLRNVIQEHAAITPVVLGRTPT